MKYPKYPILYKCRICWKDFEFLEDIVKHVEEEHNLDLSKIPKETGLDRFFWK